MTRLIFLIALTLTAGCNGAATSKQEAVTTSGNTSKTTATTDTFPLPPKVDSIDKANAATIASANDDVNKARVSLEDSILSITYNKFSDHRIFGYAKPDIHSKKMLLLSVFTNDVEGNPYKLPYGAYYQSSDMDSLQLKYVADEGVFSKFLLLKSNTPQDTAYIEKRWIDFEK